MENQSKELLQQQPQRDIETVTTEICTLVKQAQKMALVYAIEIGRRLAEAKSLLPHGEWGKWLAERTEFSQSTANNMMKIFEEYGADQISLFGAEANSQTLGNLPYTKALKLLAVPADERESFVQEHDVENISTRELEKIIKERDQAVADREQAEKYASETAEREEELEDQLKELKDSLAAKEAAAQEAADREQALKDQLLDAQRREADAKDALKKEKENKEVPDSVLKKVKADAKKEAKEAAAKDIEKAVADLEQKVGAAESQRKAAEMQAAEARAKIEDLEKKLLTASPAVAQFQVHFEQLQEILQKCREKIAEIKANGDEATAEKLANAVKAVCGQFEE